MLRDVSAQAFLRVTLKITYTYIGFTLRGVGSNQV